MSDDEMSGERDAIVSAIGYTYTVIGVSQSIAIYNILDTNDAALSHVSKSVTVIVIVLFMCMK